MQKVQQVQKPIINNYKCILLKFPVRQSWALWLNPEVSVQLDGSFVHIIKPVASDHQNTGCWQNV